VSGPVEFQQRLTIDQALEKARSLKEAHFTHITIYNVLTGVEITDLESLMVGQEGSTSKTPEGRKRPVEAPAEIGVGTDEKRWKERLRRIAKHKDVRPLPATPLRSKRKKPE
jgi:hypothetical protein